MTAVNKQMLNKDKQKVHVSERGRTKLCDLKGWHA